jgi:hypothetical protein
MLSLTAFRDSIEPQRIGVYVLLAKFAAVTLWYIRRWWALEHGRGAGAVVYAAVLMLLSAGRKGNPV